MIKTVAAFSLIECLLALFILSTACLALLKLQLFVIRQLQITRAYQSVFSSMQNCQRDLFIAQASGQAYQPVLNACLSQLKQTFPAWKIKVTHISTQVRLHIYLPRQIQLSVTLYAT